MPLPKPLHYHSALFALGVLALPVPLFAQDIVQPTSTSSSAPTSEPTFADLADLADGASVVARAQVRKASRLKPEQSPGLQPGWARLYVEARTEALLFGEGLGESLKFLADVRLQPDGKVPKLRKAQVIIFANPVPARLGELQLVAPDAQIVADPTLEARVRTLLTQMVATDAPPRITGVREAMYVPGNLAGEGETQIFLATERGDPVSITVLHRPGQPTRWGVSLGEIVDQSAVPPERDTLTWYRLACFLPAELPRDAILSGSAEDRIRAAQDYRFVIEQLGQCSRTRGR